MSNNVHIPFYNPIDPTHPKIWPDHKLLMPVCAVGNIGQLACDLIISTLLSRQECHLVGRIYSPALMPVVGPNAFTPLGGLPTTSTEVYESKKHKLVIIQQRTSYFKNLKHIYISELTRWIKESKFDQLLVLSSSFAQCNPDTSQLGQLDAVPIKTITTTSFEKSDKWLALNLKPLPDKSKLSLVRDDFLSYLPGSGLTKPLIKACQRAFIPAAFIIDFCSEGINLHDCYQVVTVLDRYLELSCRPQTHDSQQADRLSSTASDLKAALSDIERELDDGGDAFDELTERTWIEPYSWTRARC